MIFTLGFRPAKTRRLGRPANMQLPAVSTCPIILAFYGAKFTLATNLQQYEVSTETKEGAVKKERLSSFCHPETIRMSLGDVATGKMTGHRLQQGDIAKH